MNGTEDSMEIVSVMKEHQENFRTRGIGFKTSSG